MTKKIFTYTLALISLGLILVMPSANAFARDRDRSRGHKHGREEIIVGHDRYHYHDGRFYRPSWFGFEFSVVTPPFGAVVSFLPFGYRTIVVAGAPYYYYNGVYYRSCPSGYLVVPQPVLTPEAVSGPIVARSYASAPGTVTINVPNANGSFTPVTLVKQGNGYIGPQGEYYSGNPTVDQLKALYGK